MYIVTGGAGFIGSAFIAKLNSKNITDILIVDDLKSDGKWLNLRNLNYTDIMGKSDFLNEIISDGLRDINAIVHMGACSSTTERDVDFLLENNYRYSQEIAKYCVNNKVRLMYASSAATYGDGACGYEDIQTEHELLQLKPLNPYGFSKHLFDLWASRNGVFKNILGLKFFNVFGPNEYHKGDMASMIKKSYDVVKNEKVIKLFKSYSPDFKDGEQVRDFIYIKDCVDIMWQLLQKPKINGLLNVGTSIERSWNDLANSVFSALRLPSNIQYIDMPEGLKKQYQYYTKANIEKLRSTGINLKFHSLEDAIKDYVQNYLEKEDKYLSSNNM